MSIKVKNLFSFNLGLFNRQKGNPPKPKVERSFKSYKKEKAAKYARLSQDKRKLAIELCGIVAQKQHIAFMVDALLKSKSEEYRRRAYIRALSEDFRLFKGIAGKFIKELTAAVRYLRKLQNDNKKLGGKIHDYAPEKVAKMLGCDPDVIRNEIKHYARFGTHLNAADHAFHKLETKETLRSEVKTSKLLEAIETSLKSLEAQKNTKAFKKECEADVKATAPHPCLVQPSQTIQTSQEGKLPLSKSSLCYVTSSWPSWYIRLKKQGKLSDHYRDETQDDDCPPLNAVFDNGEGYVRRWFKRRIGVNEALWNEHPHTLAKKLKKLRKSLGNFTNSADFVYA